MEKLYQNNFKQFVFQNKPFSSTKQCKVYKAKHKQKNQFLFFKTYSFIIFNDHQKRKKITQQIQILKQLTGSQNIVKFIGQQQRDSLYCIVLEYCQQNNLQKIIKDQSKLDQKTSIRYIKQIIQGYKAINNLMIIHRNLQPENICQRQGILKICDFSDALPIKQILLATRRQQMIGHIHYKAPQVLQSYIYSIKSDIYSIGLIFYQMLTGKLPHNGQNKQQLLNNIKKNPIKQLIPQDLSRKSRIFLTKCLNYQKQQRMELQQLFNYSFDTKTNFFQTKHFTFQENNQFFKSDSLLKKTHIKLKQTFKPPQEQSCESDRIQINLPQNTIKSSQNTNYQHYFQFNKKKQDNIDYLKVQNPYLYKTDNKKSTQLIPSKISIHLPRDGSQSTYTNLQDMNIQSKQHLRSPSKATTIMKKLNESNVSRFSNKKITKVLDQLPILSKIKQPFFQSQNIISQNLDIDVHASFGGTQSVFPSNCKMTINDTPNKQYIQNLITDNIVIANWLLNLIDLTRFINRILYKLNKITYLSSSQNLIKQLSRFRNNLYNKIKTLQILSKGKRQNFINSSQHLKIIQIINSYEGKLKQNTDNLQQQELIKYIKSFLQQFIIFIKNKSNIDHQNIYLLQNILIIKQLYHLYLQTTIKEFYQQKNIESYLLQNHKEYNLSEILSVISTASHI